MGANIVQTYRPREGKLTRWICVANKHAGQSFSSLRTNKPALNNGCNLIFPWHGHSVARDIDKNKILVNASKSLYQLILRVRQPILLTVGVLSVLMFALVQSAKYHNIVSFSSLIYSIFNQLGFRTTIVKVLACGYTVVFTIHIAHIATLKNNIGITIKTVLQAFKR